MRFKTLISILALFVLLPVAVSFAGNRSLEGSFTRAPGQQHRYDGKTVEVIEFMSFYCGTCYEFERSIPIIKGNFPKKIKWKIVPLYWGEGSSKPGEAYFLAVDAGKGEQMKKAIFRARFVERKDIGDLKVLDSIAAKVGLGFDFSRKLRSGEKAAEAKRSLDMASAYRVEETPTVVIAGDIVTNPHGFDHDVDLFRKNVITIIKSLVKRGKVK